jgi:hypothetical protein
MLPVLASCFSIFFFCLLPPLTVDITARTRSPLSSHPVTEESKPPASHILQLSGRSYPETAGTQDFPFPALSLPLTFPSVPINKLPMLAHNQPTATSYQLQARAPRSFLPSPWSLTLQEKARTPGRINIDRALSSSKK